jgi:hypothetical protein
MAKLLPPVESMTNFGPHALEKLRPGGTIEIVFWEKSISSELEEMAKHTYMDPITKQKFRLQLQGSIEAVDRATIAPHSGYGIPDDVTVVSVGRMLKVAVP